VNDATDESQESHRQWRFERPPGACEIVLVRHGESAAARTGVSFPLVDGHGDPPLHAEGEAQAERLAERLEGEDIAAIYVTTLQRTAQTAAPTAARKGIEMRVEADLREVHLGEWEGGVFRERVAEGHPIALRMFEEGRWDVIPGAEPAKVFAARVRDGINRIAAAHPDAMVVVVSHGGVIGQVFAEATGAQPFAFSSADNASISHLVVSEGRWLIRRYNDTTHLRPSLSHAPEPLT
jgi:probable phosphoglycerate mutase